MSLKRFRVSSGHDLIDLKSQGSQIISRETVLTEGGIVGENGA